MLVASVLTLVLVVGGVVVLATAEPVSFGWFAYAPLSGDSFSTPWALAWTSQQVVGAVLVALGLLLGAGAAGYLIGRRTPRSRGAPVEPLTLGESRAVRGTGWDGPDR